jgi:ParB family transcriptional regulator, chromosome partitioning protein
MAQTGTQKFLRIPIGYIIIEAQIRSTIDMTSPSSLALKESIKRYGVVEPLIVSLVETDMYKLICGERRFWAAQEAGLDEVPVLVLPANTPEAEILALQLTENLQREDLNAIDLAHGVMKYLRAKKAVSDEKDFPAAMALLVNFNRSPAQLSEAVSTTVVEISQIAGKSITTLFNTLSLLRLNSTIQDAVKQGTLLVSQGYLFAANLDCPDLMKGFESVVATPLTNAVLEKMLTAHKKVKPAAPTAPALTLSKQHKSIAAMTKTIDKYMDRWDKDDLQKLVTELRTLADKAAAHLAGASGTSS